MEILRSTTPVPEVSSALNDGSLSFLSIVAGGYRVFPSEMHSTPGMDVSVGVVHVGIVIILMGGRT